MDRELTISGETYSWIRIHHRDILFHNHRTEEFEEMSYTEWNALGEENTGHLHPWKLLPEFCDCGNGKRNWHTYYECYDCRMKTEWEYNKDMYYICMIVFFGGIVLPAGVLLWEVAKFLYSLL